MKIVNIVPGFGGTFYCGNCLRDSGYNAALRKAGHEAIMLPMYLPLTLHGHRKKQEVPVFYGAVAIYLKQQFSFLRNMPSWLEHFLNSEHLLRLAARKSGSTRATGLEGLTESMLLGSKGNQASELNQLVDYLKSHEKPDIVHFSNALLLGMAEQIRKELNIPVVCSLQDEDVWLDAMHEGPRNQLWNLLAEKAQDVDAFIAVSQYFADLMSQRMRIPASRLHVLPIGIDTTQYHYQQPKLNPPTIGYISRINRENGFELLVDAFIRLRKEEMVPSVRLMATGGYTGDDRKFLNGQMKKIRQNQLENDVEIVHDFSPGSLREFLGRITVLSVPVLHGEAFGLYQLEALASGVPLVQPALGAFPEIINATGGGWTYSPNTSAALAARLKEVLANPDRIIEHSRKGNTSVQDLYDSAKLTRKMVDIYEKVLINKSTL